jgi:hypothetical protein
MTHCHIPLPPPYPFQSTVKKLQATFIFKKNRWRRHVLKEPPMGLVPRSSMARPISFPSFPVHHKIPQRFGQILIISDRTLPLPLFV